MRIGPVPAIDLGINSSQDSIKIQAENFEVIRAVRAINASGTLGENHELVFSLDLQSRRPVIKIINRTTHEVVRQIPNVRVLQLAEDLADLDR